MQLVDWMTDSCWVSSLTQQSRDCTAIDTCLALSPSMSGAESEWQMACRAEGPPPAGVNISVCLFSSEQSKREAFCFCPLLPFISVPAKVQWLWIMEPLHPAQTVFTFPAGNVCHLNISLCPLRSFYDWYILCYFSLNIVRLPRFQTFYLKSTSYLLLLKLLRFWSCTAIADRKSVV